MIEEQILSKMLDENNVNQVLKFNVQKEDFPTLGDVFEYIVDYRRAHGAVPDYRTVAGEYEVFDYQPGIQEPFSGLCKRLKVQSAKRRSFELLQNEAGAKYKELSGDKFVVWMEENIAKIKKATSSDFSIGTNIAVNGEERKERYDEAKERRTFSYIPTPYGSLTGFLGGGFELGDYILLQAFTNRGKSWIASHIGQTAWRAKFGVIHYSPELSKAQQTSRFETLDGHFNNSELRRGQLDNESEYFDYLEGFDGSIETPYMVKTMEDLPNGLTTDTIEADLEMNPEIKLVIIDGFNLMTHKGGSKSNRDAMSNTSRRLRQIFGRYGVAGLIVHQIPGSAEKDNKELDESGTRIVKPPTIEQYSETIAVIQDAATVINFDAHDGIGKLLIAKAREPHVGEIIDLRCNFNMGYIEEPQLTDQFL